MKESVERHLGQDVSLVLEGRPVPLRGRIEEVFSKTFKFVGSSTEYDLRFDDVKEIRTERSNACA